MKRVKAISDRQEISVFCSDVSGAFDRVDSKRLMAKLRAKGVNTKLLRLIESWLRERRAKVIVGGEFSKEFALLNMVFQGTVLGPSLWNAFFEDARTPINAERFIEIVFADDLNAYKNKRERKETQRFSNI